MSTLVIGAQLEGLDELKRKFAAMSAEARTTAVQEAAAAGAEPIRVAAQANAPILKENDPRRVAGNLRSKITAWAQSIAPGVVTWNIGVSSRDKRVGLLAAFYAGWVEYGTKLMEAIPYLRPAFDAKVKEAADRSRAVFEAFVARWGGE